MNRHTRNSHLPSLAVAPVQPTSSSQIFSWRNLLLGAGIGSVLQLTCLSESSFAAPSACVGVYSTNATGQISFLNTVTNNYFTIFDYAATSTNINGAAVEPTTGNIYFVNRANATLVYYNPNTNTSTVVSLTGTGLPAVANLVGATFKNTGELYVFYGGATRTLAQINPLTGALIGSVLTVTGIPASTGTNGDIAIDANNQAYVVADFNNGTIPQIFELNLTTAVASNGVNITNYTPVTNQPVNGLAINSTTGTYYISTSGNTYPITKTGSGATATYPVSAPTTSPATDLAACANISPNPPTISKQFSPKTVLPTPAISTLTITIGNTNLVPLYLDKVLTDTFPAGLVIAATPGLSTTCTTATGAAGTGVITATAGTSSISLAVGTKIPRNGCTISVNVTASSRGSYPNTIAAGGLSTNSGTNATATADTILVTTNAKLLLVKRITAINGQTINPNDSTKDLTVTIDSSTTTNDDPARKWPPLYLKGLVDAGAVKPGDTIEYTIYYLNDEGTDASSLKICDPIRGSQKYVPGSMKMLPGGAVNLPANYLTLTDAVATGVDRANAYGAAALPTVVAAPTDCNVTGIGSSLSGATDNGGVAIQLTGTGSSGQPNLPAIPGATAIGTPTTSYGAFRFTTKVNP